MNKNKSKFIDLLNLTISETLIHTLNYKKNGDISVFYVLDNDYVRKLFYGRLETIILKNGLTVLDLLPLIKHWEQKHNNYVWYCREHNEFLYEIF